MADEAVANTGQHYSELVCVDWRVKVCKPGLLVYLPDNETRSQKKTVSAQHRLFKILYEFFFKFIL